MADHSEAPGYQVSEGAGSKAGGCFIAANGEPIPNKGEMTLDLMSGDKAITSKFQVAKISRPLWSVGKSCDAGYTVVFDSGHGTIYHVESGEQVGVFLRKGGLYVGDMKLRNPAHGSTGQQPVPAAAKPSDTVFRRHG